MGRAGVFFFIRETPVIALAFGHALRGVDALFLALLVSILCFFFVVVGFLRLGSCLEINIAPNRSQTTGNADMGEGGDADRVA